MVEVAAATAAATEVSGDKSYEVNGQVADVKVEAVVRSVP